MKLLAHSAQPKKSLAAQAYHSHIIGVFQLAQVNVNEMLRHSNTALSKIINNIVLWAACFHDLGKLDIENQEVLNNIKKSRHLPINHVDAGVAYLKEKEKKTEAAFLVFSHHQGLPSLPEQCNREFPFRDINIKKRVDDNLDEYLSLQQKEVILNLDHSLQANIADGLTRRLAFSCLVDADHSDSAHYEKPIYTTRWEERLSKLDQYVCKAYERNEKSKRNELRNEIYFACRKGNTNYPIHYCDSPVGTGKTTAIMAYLIQAAIQKKLRHIIVVL